MILAAAVFLTVIYSNYIENDYKIAIYIINLAVFFVFLLFLILGKEVFYKSVFSLVLLCTIFLFIFLILDHTGMWEKVNSVDALRKYIASFGPFAVFVFIAIQFLQVVLIPIPGTVTTLGGAIMFGPFWGAVYSYIGIVLGSVTAFLIGRIFGYKLVSWIVGKDQLKKGMEMIKNKSKVMFTLMFLLPFFPDDLICFVAGLTTMSLFSFTVIIMVTRIITVGLTCYTIDLVQYFASENVTLGIIIVVAGILITILLFYLGVKYGERIENFFTKNKDDKRKKSVKLKRAR